MVIGIVLRVKFSAGRQFCALLQSGRKGNRQLFVAAKP